MYYATAGQQATQRPGTGAPGLSQSSGAPGFPPLAGVLGRGGPPGFAGRNTDTNDFPALGSHPQHSSTYAASAQSQQQPTGSTSSQHLPQQQLFMQGQPGLAPPPPPGIVSSPNQQHPNGLIGDGLRGEDFPALGGGAEGRDRAQNYLRNQPPASPPSLANGTSASNSATPSTNPPLPASGGGTFDSWRQSPGRGNEPVIRPVQQIMSSPVDKWGLKALLYEIKMNLDKSDRSMMMFGEELEDLGVDLSQEEPLYPTFVTPWLEPSQITQPPRIEETTTHPSCYNVVPPPVQTKIPNFTEDTLFYAFYASPQDVLQLEVAEELYARGWRFHTELHLWMSSPAFANAPLDTSSWLRGPFMVFDPNRFARTKTSDDFMVDASALEITRPATAIINEEQARKEAVQRSPNGSAGSVGGGYGH